MLLFSFSVSLTHSVYMHFVSATIPSTQNTLTTSADFGVIYTRLKLAFSHTPVTALILCSFQFLVMKM